MSLRSKDAAIDEIVASCSGDLRGAVRALLLINEHLEAELAKRCDGDPEAIASGIFADALARPTRRDQNGGLDRGAARVEQRP